MGDEAMTYERAVEIVGACVENGVYMHLGDGGRVVPSLATYSLAEMVEAQRIVKETENAARQSSPGPHTYHMICDDRLVAALYVASHFPGDDPSDANPVCLLPDGRAVLVISMREALATELQKEAPHV